MACSNLVVKLFGNENSLSKYLINKVAFNPPASDTYSVKTSHNNIISHSTLSNFKDVFFSSYGGCVEKVDFISKNYPLISTYCPFISTQAYLVSKRDIQSHICIIYLKNANSTKNISSNKIIYSHGSSSDIGDNLPFLYNLCTLLKCDVVSYDYSGFGCSSGSPSEETINSDLKQVINFCIEDLHFDIQDIILFGYSIGSVCTVNMSINHKFHQIAGVALLSPLVCGLNTYFVDTKEKNNILISSNELNTNFYRISRINQPILLIHGKMDELVPFIQVNQMVRQIKNVFQWFPSGGNHLNIPSQYRTKFFTKFQAFIERINASKNTLSIRESKNQIIDKEINIGKKIETIKNYINKEDNINSQDTSIRMFVNDEGENETEVTGIPSSQIASMGNNNYYGSIKKTKYDVMFNLKFGKNTD